MDKIKIAFVLCTISFGVAAAESPRPEIDARLSGPNMADPQPGDLNDRLIIKIEGDRAKDIFDAMPGTGKPIMGCYDRPTKKSRGLLCSSDEDGKYWCSVGVKLDTGETVIGSIC